MILFACLLPLSAARGTRASKVAGKGAFPSVRVWVKVRTRRHDKVCANGFLRTETTVGWVPLIYTRELQGEFHRCGLFCS